MASIDHIVLLAETLDAGREFVMERLGVAPAVKWTNALFATHSLALRLGDSCYLEILAVDPDAADPPRVRWYGLDDRGIRRTLARRPRLFAWALAVADLDATCEAATFDAGSPLSLVQGDLDWRQTVPADGELVLSGAGPVLIERRGGGHPALRMPDQHCTLETLRISDGEPFAIRNHLASVGAADLVAIEEGNRGERRFETVIATPDGPRLLL